MPERSDIGIECTDQQEWIVAIWSGEKLMVSPPFKNTSPELLALVRFITANTDHPKICLKPISAAALRLIQSIGEIPRVEVVLLSEAGFEMQRAWMKKRTMPAMNGHAGGQAALLASCAERMTESNQIRGGQDVLVDAIG